MVAGLAISGGTCVARAPLRRWASSGRAWDCVLRCARTGDDRGPSGARVLPNPVVRTLCRAARTSSRSSYPPPTCNGCNRRIRRTSRRRGRRRGERRALGRVVEVCEESRRDQRLWLRGLVLELALAGFGRPLFHEVAAFRSTRGRTRRGVVHDRSLLRVKVRSQLSRRLLGRLSSTPGSFLT